MPKYTPLAGPPMTLSASAIEYAFGGLDFTPPCIVVGKDQVGAARRIAKHMAINYRKDTSLREGEWYLEWRGKRVGADPY